MNMKSILWNTDKNLLLKERRGLGFEDIVEALADGRLLADLPNSSQKFPHQRIYVVEIDGYAVLVPYIEDDNGIFLKTAFPDRKATRKFLKEN